MNTLKNFLSFSQSGLRQRCIVGGLAGLTIPTLVCERPKNLTKNQQRYVMFHNAVLGMSGFMAWPLALTGCAVLMVNKKLN